MIVPRTKETRTVPLSCLCCLLEDLYTWSKREAPLFMSNASCSIAASWNADSAVTQFTSAITNERRVWNLSELKICWRRKTECDGVEGVASEMEPRRDRDGEEELLRSAGYFWELFGSVCENQVQLCHVLGYSKGFPFCFCGKITRDVSTFVIVLWNPVFVFLVAAHSLSSGEGPTLAPGLSLEWNHQLRASKVFDI